MKWPYGQVGLNPSGKWVMRNFFQFRQIIDAETSNSHHGSMSQREHVPFFVFVRDKELLHLLLLKLGLVYFVVLASIVFVNVIL